jgi:CheY-like chemotaxis protein
VIRAGLGTPTSEVAADDLLDAATELAALAPTTPVEKLAARARECREELDDAHVSAHLNKPVRSAQLHELLLRVLQPAAHVPDPGSAAPSARQPGRGRVLVVEDNAINQLVARGLLDRLGFVADLAGNGHEALAALERNGYAAVLMDCQMPEMDGYTATAEIRRREGKARHLPIIAMTAGALAGDEERCLAAGMDAYLPKPIDSLQLEAVLARWVVGETSV